MFKKAFIFACFIAISGFAIQVEPFSAGEGAAIEIYETALPLLEACEFLIEDVSEAEIDCSEIETVAIENEIEMEPIEKAVTADPNMTRFAIVELKSYSRNNLLLAEDEEDTEFKAALLKAGLDAFKHAVILETLVDKWAPLEKPPKGK